MMPISASWFATSAFPTIPGVKGPSYAGKEVSDQRRQAQLARQQATKERENEPHGNRGNERDVVRHWPPEPTVSFGTSVIWR